MGKNFILYHIFLSFISPVLALLVAAKSASKKYIIFGSTLLMGFVGSVFIASGEIDGVRHLARAKDFYTSMSFQVFIRDVWSLLTFEPSLYASDLYIHLISYFCASLIGSPDTIFVFSGLIIGYFFSKSILLLFEDKTENKLGILLTFIIIIFLLSNTITGINGMRMWPAMWVFFYGGFSLVKKKQPKYILVIFFAFFIHFSYLLYALPLAIAFLLRKRRVLIVVVFIMSHFFTVNYEFVTNLFGETGLYEEKVSISVRDEETKEILDYEYDKTVATSNFYRKYGPDLYASFSTPFLGFVLILIYLSARRIDYVDFLVASGLLIIVLSNLSGGVGREISARGFGIASTFLVASTIIILLKRDFFLSPGLKSAFFNIGLFIFIASSVPYIIYNVSYIFNTISLFIFIIPALSWLLGVGDITIKDFLLFNF